MPLAFLVFALVSQYGLASLQTCHQYFPLCAECSSDFTQCLVCKRHPDGTYISTCVPTCEAFHSHLPHTPSRSCRSNCSQACEGLCIGDSQCKAASSECEPWEVWDEQSQACSYFSCPSGFYNEGGLCKACHSSCASCSGGSADECLSCMHPLYLSNPFEVGTCEVKPASNAQYDLFVENYESPPSAQLDGTLTHPFGDLRDALIRAAQLAEIYPQVTINIFLTRGVHYIPLEDESQRYGSAGWLHHSRLHFQGTIQPLWCDYSASQVRDICSYPGEKVEIRVKVGAYFTIPIPDSLLVSDLTFDFSDSLVTWNSGCQSQRAQSCELTLLNDLPVVSSHNSECQCTSPLRLASSCDFNHPLSLFQAKGEHHKALTFANSEIRNTFTDYSSIFSSQSQVSLTLQNSQFNNISLCGSIINTESTPPFASNVYSQVQSVFMTHHKAEGQNLDLIIQNCKFTKNGLALHFSSSPLSLLYQDGTEFIKHGSVLNLHNYPGQVKIIGNQFKENKIYLNADMQGLDQQPGSGVVLMRRYLLKSAVLHISESTHGVTLLQNKFIANSGLKGVVRLEMPSSYSKGTLLFENEFSHNSGYFESSVLTLISSQDPQAPLSCSGFQMLHSIFSHNVALSNSMSLINLHCSSPDIPQANIDGHISFQEQLLASGSDQFPDNVTPDPQVHMYAINASFSLIIDYQKTVIQDVLVYENFKPQSGALFIAHQIRDLEVQNVRFIRNGDFALAQRYESMKAFCHHMGGLHSEASVQINERDSILGDSTLLLVRIQTLSLRNILIRESYASQSLNQNFGSMLGLRSFKNYEIDSLQIYGLFYPDDNFLDLLQSDHGLAPFQPTLLTQLQVRVPILTSMRLLELRLVRTKISMIMSSFKLIQAESSLTLVESEIFRCQGAALISGVSLSLMQTKIHHSSLQSSAFETSHLQMLNSTLLSLEGTLQNLQQGQSLLVQNSHIQDIVANSASSPQLFLLSSGPQVILRNTTFSSNRAGSLFSIQQGKVEIYNCSFNSNVGLTGSVALISGKSQIISHEATYFNNSANTGGVFYLQDRATLNVYDSTFQENKALNIAGVFFFIGKSQFCIQRTKFYRNEAYSYGSVIHGVSEDKRIAQKIQWCQFVENKGLSTLYTFQTQLQLQHIKYWGNQDHQSQSSPVYFIGSLVQLLYSQFSNEEYMDTLCSDENGNKGGFVYDLSDNDLLISKCVFKYGCAYQGGAMLMSGSSEVVIDDSDFEHNQSFEYGGAIYALDFLSWKVQGSRFKNNQALEEAADIYLQDSFNILEIQNSTFTGENNSAVQCLWTRMSIRDSYFQNIEIDSDFGAVVECINCAYFVLQNNTFENLKAGLAAEASGFLTYLGIDTHSLRVINNTFRNVDSALSGGGLYVSEVAPNNMRIEYNTFENVRSLANGGGVTVEQSEEDENEITIEHNSFRECSAVQGGAIYWSKREPLIQNNQYSNNTALIYGKEIASYGRRIGFVSEKFVQQERDQTTVALNLFELTQQQSGGELSTVYIAHFDKYGQVVRSINGDTIFAKVEEASLSNNNRNQWINGILKLEGLKLIGRPGSLYQISLTSPHINEQAPDVKAYLAQSPHSSSDIMMSIHLRKCKPGEAYLSSGECQRCAEGTYLLEEYSSPQECFQCPEQAVCFGGDQIGPKPGFWRSDRMSVNFFNCFNEQACLGSHTGPHYDPQGSCHEGYTGVLCGQCEEGFTRNSRFECSKCPPFGTNVILLVTFLLLLIVAVVMFIQQVQSELSFTLRSVNKDKSVFSIYVKAFVNHLQLLMLVSSFNLSWPTQVSSFLNTSKSVADAPQQLFSIDCFIQSSNPPIKRFYIYLIMYSLMPLIGLLSICIFWGLRFRHSPQRRANKIISSSLVYFFLIHPAVTTVIMQSFYCIDVDGTYRLAQQLSEECWTGDHMAFSMSVGLLGLLIWTLGIPTCTMLLLYDQRKNRALRSVKEKYGFLYKGYTQRSYMWEILVMYRKVFIAFISIFLASYGTMTQALVLLVVVMLFIFLTLRKRPFETDHLNELEVVSLFALIITVYCGLFFLSSRHPSSLGFEYRRDFYLTTSGRWMLFVLILVSNLTFLVLWVWRLFSDLRDTLRSRCRRFYLCCCLLCNRNLLAMEIKDSREEQKNYQKIKQIEEICEGKIRETVELEKYKRLYRRNQDFVDKQMFEELLHLISTRLNKIHRWKQKAFIKRSRRVTLATMPETARDELIQINPREFEGLPERQTIEMRAVDTEVYDTEIEQHSTTDFQRSKLRKPTSFSNVSVNKKDTFSRRASCLMQNFEDSLTPHEPDSPERKSTVRQPSLIEYDFQSSQIMAKRGGKSQFCPKNKLKRQYSIIRKSQPERIHEELKDDIQASDILENLEAKEESFELTYIPEGEKSTVRPQHTTETESYTTGRVDSLEFSPECVRRGRGMIRVENQDT